MPEITSKSNITSKDALEFHKNGKPGKLQISATKPLATARDLSLAYSPGVAAPVKEIAKNPDLAYDYTSKGNLVAVISNGSAILGLGNLGSLASKPVMEGKSVLFKRFADIDSIDIEIDNDIDLDKLNFSIKVYNSLMRNGCKKLSDIKNLTDWEILGMKNMGESGLLEIKTNIRRYESSSHVLFKENKKDNNDFDNELSSINIKNDNEVNTKSEPINSEVKEDVNQEQPLFKLDFASLFKIFRKVVPPDIII